MPFAPVMLRSTKAPGATRTLPGTVQLLLEDTVQDKPAGCMEPGVPVRSVTVTVLAWVEKTARLVAVQPFGTQVRTELASLRAAVAPLTE